MELIGSVILGILVLLLISYGFHVLFTEETRKESLIEKMRDLAEASKQKRIEETKHVVFNNIELAAKNGEFETCVRVDIDIIEDIETILEKEGFIVYKPSSDLTNRLYISWENNNNK